MLKLNSYFNKIFNSVNRIYLATIVQKTQTPPPKCTIVRHAFRETYVRKAISCSLLPAIKLAVKKEFLFIATTLSPLPNRWLLIVTFSSCFPVVPSLYCLQILLPDICMFSHIGFLKNFSASVFLTLIEFERK